MRHAGDTAYRNLSNLNPFYEMLPGTWRLVGHVLATLAAILPLKR
nr:KUP/HAK/KT family potassium transporter [Lactiplantibacillus plantarum]